MAKEVVALANLQGGPIFIGVEDDVTITGLKHNNTQEWLLTTFRDKVYPQLIPLRLFESGGLFHVEVLPIAGTRMQHLDGQHLDFYFSNIIKDPDIPATDEEWEKRLLGLGLMAPDGLGIKVCPVAGLLCQ